MTDNNATVQPTAPTAESNSEQVTDQQANEQALGNELTWDKVAEEHGLTPAQAVELAKRQANWNKYTDRKSKELAREMAEAKKLKETYEAYLKADPRLAQTQGQNTQQNDDDLSVEQKLAKLLENNLAPLKQQQEQLKEILREEQVSKESMFIDNTMSELDKRMPGYNLNSENSLVRKLALTKVANELAVTGEYDRMSRTERAEAMEAALKDVVNDLKRQGFIKADATYAQAKKQVAKESASENGRVSMGGNAVNDDVLNQNQDDFFKDVFDTFKKIRKG